MRPKFTIANLLLLTVIVAMGAQMYRNYIRFQELNAEIALHKTVLAQSHRVRQRELELQAMLNQSEPELQMARFYRWVGAGDQLAPNVADSANTRLVGLNFAPSVGLRRAAAQLRNAELRLLRERGKLQQLERDLSQRFGD